MIVSAGELENVKISDRVDERQQSAMEAEKS